MLEIVIAIIAAASISIFLVHAVEAYLTAVSLHTEAVCLKRRLSLRSCVPI